MHRVKRFLLSRTTIITLFSFILLMVLLGALLPQRFDPEETKKWEKGYPELAIWQRRLGFDHVYTTPVFAVALVLFFLSLVLSGREQLLRAWKMTFRVEQKDHGSGWKSHTSADDVRLVCRKFGYHRTAISGGWMKLIRHPWGHWGNAMLHLGIICVITASFVVVVTQKRGRLEMVEGEIYQPGDRWLAEEHGLLSEPFLLPSAVRMDKVIPEFHETGQLKELETEVSLGTPDSGFTPHRLKVSNMLKYHGLNIYQEQRFGHAFFVRFIDESGLNRGALLQIPHPMSQKQPGYRDFFLEWMVPFFKLKTKYYADVNRQSVDGLNPELVLRLVKGEEVFGQVSLQTGQKGMLGPYLVQLDGVKKWAELFFVEIHGLGLLFYGCGMALLGGGLHYFTPPRVLLVRSDAQGCTLFWKAVRFSEFYEAERNMIHNSLTGDKNI